MTRSREAILFFSTLLFGFGSPLAAAEGALDVYERTYTVAGEPETLRWLADGDLAVRLRSGEWRRLDRETGRVVALPMVDVPPAPFTSVTVDPITHEVAGNGARWGSFGARTSQFCRPEAAATHEGRIYVADTGNHRVQVFTTAGDFLYRFGRHQLHPRQGEGHLHYPTDVLIDPAGDRAYVAEPLEDRIQVFRARTSEDPPSDPRLGWERADLPAHFGEHWAVSGSWLLISEPDAERVSLYKMRGTREPVRVSELGGIPGERLGAFRNPGEVWAIPGATRPEFLVHDRGNHRWQIVRVRNPDAPLRFDRRLLESVSALRWPDREPRLLVLERDRIGAVKEGSLTWTSRRGEPISTQRLPAGTPRAFASREGDRLLITADDAVPQRTFAHFCTPTERGWRWSNPVPLEGDIVSAASEEDGTWRLIDRRGDGILWIDGRGKPVKTFGARGVTAGTFHHLRAALRDESGHLWTLDMGNHRAQVFDGSGKLLVAFGSRNYLAPLRKEASE